MELSDIAKIDFDDGKRRVLILGNGISRYYYNNIYDIWKDEIWGCNWVYKEYIKGGIPRLDALIGDYSCLKYAHRYKNKELKNTVIYGKNERSIDLGDVRYPKGDKNRFRDSGTTIVAHAIESGYDEIYLLGFDLGGRDIYQKHHHLRNKKSWIDSWRRIDARYELDKVYFIGYDHKKTIQSDIPNDYYAQMYMRGRDHLENYYKVDRLPLLNKEEIEKIENQENNRVSTSVLILGNGKSRTEGTVKRFISNWRGEVWGCNGIYKEAKFLPNLHRVGIIDDSRMINDLYTFIYEKSYNFDIYTYDFKDGFDIDIKVFQDNRKFLVGQQMILQALYEEYDSIYLAGFDFGGVDAFNRKTKGNDRMVREMRNIVDEFGLDRLHFVRGVSKVLL
jgi:hypothetical protein